MVCHPRVDRRAENMACGIFRRSKIHRDWWLEPRSAHIDYVRKAGFTKLECASSDDEKRFS